MKKEALKLADELDALHQYVPSEAPAMIRRLVEELDKWEKDLHLQSHVLGFMEGKASQAEEQMMLQKPLNDDEIIEMVKEHFIGAIKLGIVLSHDNVLGFARAIEQRHGIK